MMMLYTLQKNVQGALNGCFLHAGTLERWHACKGGRAYLFECGAVAPFGWLIMPSSLAFSLFLAAWGRGPHACPYPLARGRYIAPSYIQKGKRPCD